MKTKTILLCLSIILLLLSCEKEKALPLNFKVLKNGNEWVSTSNSVIYSIWEKKFMIHAQKGVLQASSEILYISFEVNDLSNPIQNNVNSTLYNLIGGDGMSNRFNLTSDPFNNIQIISIDTISKKITGNFNLKLSRDPYYNQPDTLLLTEGYFSLPYQEAYIYNK